ncbi:uncharacterized protein FFB20_05334 [Fusarium fujikuroi]|nr:uncharacterized protein FFB20_05334 [Fusarium fujikuroi]SCN81774.1 uncharacterized protein FFE2_04771 [Fusarium fujikuroi]SCN84317.1 uncharacterized protein FFM5_03314 [Fusarium fujikuroi]SCN85243.1 uncharacterized protein FFC1_04821 [Fusarium fujikuroi]SCO34174.1 uncharacterized protein FFNC_03679 [Fusarium fujikuroi]
MCQYHPSIQQRNIQDETSFYPSVPTHTIPNYRSSIGHTGSLKATGTVESQSAHTHHPSLSFSHTP